MRRYTAVLAVILAALLAALHLHPPGAAPSAEAQPVVNWLDLAAAAWGYFAPLYGVSSRGVNYASPSWHYVTDWDLGCYISAIIDAEEIGLLPREGGWGADDRIRKVLHFLSVRPLHPSGVPYWGYNSDTFEPYSSAPSNPSDAGRLLVALYRLKRHRPDLAATIDYVVQRNGFGKFASGVVANGFYAYYIAHGFYFWGFVTPQVEEALRLPEKLRFVKKVNAYGVELPYVEVTMEPILLAIFELNPSPSFFEWAYRAYKAQENRYLATGKPTAFSEGMLPVPPHYIYEWIVDIYSGDTFTVWNPVSGRLSRTPVVYAKAALGMHAVWSTNYTLFLAQYVMKARTPNGFYEGVDEDGRIIYSITDKTNAMIISAARYALRKSEPPTLQTPQSVTVYAGETTRVEISVTHSLPIPVKLSAKAAAQINVTVSPSEVVTNSTATLTISAEPGAKPGHYEVQITATSPAGNQTSTLSLEVLPPGYALTVKVVDSRGRPVPNATVTAGSRKASTGPDGVAVIKHLNGRVEVTVAYHGVAVWGPASVEVLQDTALVASCSLYEVHVLAVTPDNRPAPGVLLVVAVEGRELASAVTNATGYATFQRVPGGNVTIYAYTPDKAILLAEWHVQITGDGEVVDPYIEPPSREPQLLLPALAAALTLSAILLLRRVRVRARALRA
ncbi:MAG: DUF3131 domain-containing protein [Thermofilaceae archaeon]